MNASFRKYFQARDFHVHCLIGDGLAGKWFTILCGVVAIGLTPGKLGAAGTVSVLDEAHLRAAMAGGGLVNFTASGVIALTNSISITSDTVIDGTGQTVTISGGGLNRLFYVNSGVTLDVTNVVLANGFVGGAAGSGGNFGGPGGVGEGGGIFNDGGTVELYGCSVTNCRTVGGAGGGGSFSVGNGGDAVGGALFSQNGTVVLSSTTFASNSATGGVGGTLQGMPAAPGLTGAGLGGALFTTNGTVTVLNSLFRNNNCQGASAGALGGAILQASGSLTVSNGLFLNNGTLSSRDSGGVGVGLGAGGAIASLAGTATVEYSQAVSNSAVNTGGTGSTFMRPGPAQGGAVYSVGTLVVDHTTIQGNSATGNTGRPTPPDVCGGGLFNGGNAIIGWSTISSNVATGGDGEGILGNGGRGLGGGIYNAAQMTATNCTVAFNSAVQGSSYPETNGDALGGGIANFGGTLTGMNLTVAGNSVSTNIYGAFGFPGGTNGAQIATTNGTSTIENTILAYGGQNPNVWGPITDAGYNICSDDSAGFSYPTSMDSVDPLLQPLSNNGWPTATMALASGSPAIGFGTSVGAPTTDQRGLPRAMGPSIDAGAYERQTIVAPPPAVTFAPAAGGLQLGFAAVAGVQYRLQASSNLVSWATIQYFGPYSGSTNISISISTGGQGSENYRILVPGY